MEPLKKSDWMEFLVTAETPQVESWFYPYLELLINTPENTVVAIEFWMHTLNRHTHLLSLLEK